MKNIEQFAELLKDSNVNIRLKAINEIGLPKDPKLIELLITMLKDNNSQVAYTAGNVLSTSNDVNIVNKLLDLFQEPSEVVRNRAIYTIAKFGEVALLPLLEALQDKDPKIRASAASTLAMLKEQPNKPYAKRLSDIRILEPLLISLSDENSLVRLNAVRAISIFKDTKVVETLINCLNDENIQVVAEAIRALQKINDKRAYEPLLKLLERREGPIQLIIATLAKLGEEKVIDNFLPILLNQQENFIWRENIVWVLGRLGNKRAIEPLLSILLNEEDPLYIKAGLALAELNEERAVIPLTHALLNQNKKIRRDVAFALTKIANHYALPFLIDALEDEYANIRYYVVQALGKIGNKEVLPKLEWILDNDSGINDEIESPDLELKTVKRVASVAIASIKNRIKDG
jgi:HEAT repeat protein